MTRIVVSRISNHSVSVLWPLIADVESHPDWMKEAKRIVFIGDQRRGVGTRMKVVTLVGPLRTVDEMEVVGWEENHYIDVRHVGVVTGTGRLGLTEIVGGTVVTWDETLAFPWWLGGPMTAWLARPVLKRFWTKNLERLDSLASDR